MAQSQAIRDLYKALNTLHSLFNDQSARIDNFLNGRCDDNRDQTNDTQDALCSYSEETDARVADIETALCDLSELIEG